MGASPQLLVTAFGPHKTGAVRNVSDVLFQQGASIARTKKIIVEDQFAMMLSVYTPGDPAELVCLMESDETAAKLGFPLLVKHLDTSQCAIPSADSARAHQYRGRNGTQSSLAIRCIQVREMPFPVAQLISAGIGFVRCSGGG